MKQPARHTLSTTNPLPCGNFRRKINAEPGGHGVDATGRVRRRDGARNGTHPRGMKAAQGKRGGSGGLRQWRLGQWRTFPFEAGLAVISCMYVPEVFERAYRWCPTSTMYLYRARFFFFLSFVFFCARFYPTAQTCRRKRRNEGADEKPQSYLQFRTKKSVNLPLTPVP